LNHSNKAFIGAYEKRKIDSHQKSGFLEPFLRRAVVWGTIDLRSEECLQRGGFPKRHRIVSYLWRSEVAVAADKYGTPTEPQELIVTLERVS
jgi:hypothetical protein